MRPGTTTSGLHHAWAIMHRNKAQEYRDWGEELRASGKASKAEWCELSARRLEAMAQVDEKEADYWHSLENQKQPVDELELIIVDFVNQI